MKEPLLAPAVALASGILLARFATFRDWEVVWPMAALVLLVILSLRLGAQRLCPMCAILFCFFAGIWTGEHNHPGPPPQLNAEANESLLLAGCVVEPLAIGEDRVQLLLELAPAARIRVNLPMHEGEVVPDVFYGQQVEVPARIRIPHNFGNPGAFDYAGYLSRQNIYWTGSAKLSDVKVVPGQCGNRFWAVIYSMRTAVLNRIESLYRGDTYATGMMEAMLLGDSTKLQKVWTVNFRRTGTYHALVISGLHVSVLAAALLLVLRVIAIPKQKALLVAALAAWLYALITGWQPPVVRAAGGFTLFVIARLFYRRGRVVNLLCAVAIAYCFFDPGILYDASFQLSFLSVAAIGLLAVPFIEKTSGPYVYGTRSLANTDIDLQIPIRVASFRVELRLVAETIALWTRLPLRLVNTAIAGVTRGLLSVYEMMLISLTVQIGLALPMIFYFHRVAFTGISANIAVVPLLSAAVPIVFAALLTSWKWLAWIGKLLLDLSRAVVDLHVQWEPAWRTPDPPFWFALTFVAALIAAGLLQGRLRALASVAVIALFAVLCRAPFGPAVPVGRMELTAIDVGQGDSLLLTLPEGRTVLIDGGGFPTFGHSKPSSFDMGEEVVSPYLWSRQIRDVDVVVTTHAHEDHTGGMRALIENFHPKELWTGADSEESPVWRSVAEAAHGAGTKIVPMQTGRKFHFGGADFEVLWPAADYIPARSPKNNDSLVFRVSYGKRSFLLTGDMEKQAEARLLAENLVQGVDVLKVGHHGSRTSSIEPFLDAVHAPFALVSVGAGNSYRHPSPEVLERLEQRHSSILRTDEKGQVVISTDGRKIEVNTYHWLHPEQAGSLALGAPFGAGF